MCTAPPPITAPPHAHAQSFAKAIRTDILFSFSLLAHPLHQVPVTATHHCYATKGKTKD